VKSIRHVLRGSKNIAGINNEAVSPGRFRGDTPQEIQETAKEITMIEKEYLEKAIPGIFIASHGKDLGTCKIEYVNPSLIKLFGRDLKGECIIKPDYWVKPEMRSVYLDMLNRDGKVDGIEAELRRADGSIFWCKIYSRYLSIQNTKWLQGTILTSVRKN